MVEKKKKQQITSEDLLRIWPWGEIEVQFHPTRRWRFDWALPAEKIAVELDGYQYHTSRAGWLKDMEKMNEADLLGWHVFHVTPRDIENGNADQLMNRILLAFVGDHERIIHEPSTPDDLHADLNLDSGNEAG